MTNLLKLLFISLIVTTIFSCGKDDDPTTTTDPDNPFVGTWNLAEITTDATQTSTFAGQSTVTEVDNSGSNMTYSITFTGDSYTAVGGFDLLTVSTIMGNETTNTNTISNIDQSGTYTYTATTISTSEALVSLDVNGTGTTTTTDPEPQAYTIDANGDLVFMESATTTETLVGATIETVSTSLTRYEKQ